MTEDIQLVILASIVKDSYLMSKVVSVMHTEYFESAELRLIYQKIKYYYDKYASVPTLPTLRDAIDNSTTDLIDKSSVKQLVNKLWEMPPEPEDFVLDKVTYFVRSNNVKRTLQEYLPKLKSDESDNTLEELGEKLSNSIELEVGTEQFLTLSDQDKLPEVRKAAVGSDGNSIIIESSIPSINKALQYGGYKFGDLVAFIAPPGCFVGDTRLMMLDGSTKTFEELYKEKQRRIGVYSSDKEDEGMVKVSIADSVMLTKYVKDLIEVEIDGKYKVRCTTDHPFLLRNCSYKKAEDLVAYDSLMPCSRRYNEREFLTNYELVTTTGFEEFTHHLAGLCKYGSWSKKGYEYHHIDFNPHNNHPDNIRSLKSSEHRSLHVHRNIEKFGWGVSTRLTSEQVTQRNYDVDFQKKCQEGRKRYFDNGGREIEAERLRQRNLDKEFQDKTKRSKCLSGLNLLIMKYGKLNISIDNYNSIIERARKDFPGFHYFTSLWNIAYQFDCIVSGESYNHLMVDSQYAKCPECGQIYSIGRGGTFRKHVLNHSSSYIKFYDHIDFDKLRKEWNSILDQAEAYNHKVTKVTRIVLDEAIPVYGLVEVSKYHNYAIALDDKGLTGVIVSNTGKSFSLINEGVSAISQGFEVLHIFVGDMSLYDGWVRYASNITGIYQEQIIKMPIEEQQKLTQDYNKLGYFDRVSLVSYPSESITVNQLIRDVGRYQSKLKKKFDMIIVDYPDNLIAESDMMYLSGGTIYNKLQGLGIKNRSVVLIASQPKITYYGYEIIPLEGAAESSKKQQNLDLMITLGKPYRDFPYFTGFIPKNRRGVSGTVFRVKTEFECARMSEVSHVEYSKSLTEYQQSQGK